jgi:hypothetical protein
VVACSTTGSVKTLKDTFSSAEAARQAEHPRYSAWTVVSQL